MTIDPGSTDAQYVYKFLIGAIVPRPIAFVSSLSASGVRNLAPFSFFTVASANPPVVCFCPLVRPFPSPPRNKKDTLNNIRETREFVVNIVSEEFAAQMNLTSGDYPPDVDEFEVSRLTPVTSDLVTPPRAGESKFSMECKLLKIVDVSDKPLGGSIVLGEVVRIHIKDSVIREGKIDPDLLNAIGRMGGPTYSRTRDRFDLERPKV